MTPKSHYTTDDLVRAFEQTGIRRGDVVLVYASLGRLGYSERGKTMLDACVTIEEALRRAVGDEGTILVPTYTYSIGRRELFDVEASPSTIGDFTEYMRTRPDARRSADPMLAVSGIGPSAATLFADLPKTCFGPGCLYARLDEVGAKICMIGLDLHWATYRHYIEAIAEVPFRFAKTFEGVIRERGIERRERWIYHAAPRIPQCAPNGAPLAEVARQRGISVGVNVGRAAVTVTGCREYFSLGISELKRDPWNAAKGPPLSVAEILALEDARVGASPIPLSVGAEATSAELIEALAAVRRNEVSDGADAAANAIAARGGWTLHAFPSGTRLGADVVPEKWSCHEGALERADGALLISTASTSSRELQVVAGSFPFDGSVEREALLPRLRIDPKSPESAPHVRAPSAPHDWELACTRAFKDSLREPSYRVRIRTSFSFGAMRGAELAVGDARTPAVVLCATFCPSESGDDLGGLGVLLEVVRAATTRPLTGAFRALALPSASSIGAWLDRLREHRTPPVLRGGLMLETGEGEPTLELPADSPDEWASDLRRARERASPSLRIRASQSTSGPSELPLYRLSLPRSGDSRGHVSQRSLESSADLVLHLLAHLSSRAAAALCEGPNAAAAR